MTTRGQKIINLLSNTTDAGKEIKLTDHVNVLNNSNVTEVVPKNDCQKSAVTNSSNFSPVSSELNSEQLEAANQLENLLKNYDDDDNNVLSDLMSEITDYEPFDDSDADKNFVPDSDSLASSENLEIISNTSKQDSENEQNSNVEVEIRKKKINIRKEIQKKRNSGLEYNTKNGKVVKARKIVLLGNCRKKCAEKINPEDQKMIFDEYWALGCFNRRVSYFALLISTDKKKTMRVRNAGQVPRPREVTHRYFAELRGRKVEICKGCFRRVFCETNKFIETVIKKKKKTFSGQTSPDKRGRSQPPNTIGESAIKAIKDHINSYPAYESHYNRRDTSKKYLAIGLNLSLMYDMYKKKVETPVSRTYFSNIFRTMGLAFKQPSLDTCNKCDSLSLKIKFTQEPELSQLKTSLDLHKSEAEFAYTCKKMDKSSDTNEKRTYCFDLQQCLPTPMLTSNTVFYKRQLWTFNLTVYDCFLKQATCYMWHEAEGGRGANQIASCIFNFILNLSPDIKEIIFYSDTCGGQNKNSHVAAMFMCAMQRKTSLKSITHKFLVPGHSHMECDSIHSVIERKKKNTQIAIHLPRDWYNLVRTAGKKKQIDVIVMKNNMFLDFASLLKGPLQLKKTDESGEKFLWHNAKCFMYNTDYCILHYKTTLDENENFKKMCFKRRGQTNTLLEPGKCYQNLVPISKEKKKDLISLLDLIDPDCHEFYKSLPDSNIRDIDPDIQESDED